MRKLTSTLLFTAFIIGVLQLELSYAICNREPLPSDFHPQTYLSSGSLQQLPHPSDVIITSYRFSCTGEVTQWEAYTTGSGSHSIQFQVWREISGTRRYQIVGSNTFVGAAPTSGVLRLNVPLNERFTVVSGDIVGVSLMKGSEEDPFQILTVCGTSTVYNLTDSDFNNGVLQLGSFFGVDCTSPSTFFDSSGLTTVPLINAVIDGTARDTPTNTPAGTMISPTEDTSTTDDSNETTTNITIPQISISDPIVIATAVLAALLLITIITLVSIVVGLCCYIQRRGRSDSHQKDVLTMNMAYGGSGGGGRQESVRMNPNNAYNNQTGDDGPYYSSIRTNP